MSGPLCLVIRDLSLGGAERVFVRLANFYASVGVEVHLVCLTQAGPLLLSLDTAVHLHVLGKPSIRQSAGALRCIIMDIQPRAVLSTLPQVNVLVVLMLRTLRRRPRIIVREANDPVAEFPFRTRWRAAVLFLIGMIYRMSDGVLAVSEGVADSLAFHLKIPRKKLHAIPNASLDGTIHVQASSGLTETEQAELTSYRYRIVCVARFVVQKDHQTLLKAMQSIAESCDAALILIGHGPLESRLRAQATKLGIAERVLFVTGETNPYRWLASSSLCVLSSRWEGSPNVLIEAMALGTPVVSTDCPSGPREILGNGQWGRLVPVGDHKALADAVLATLSEVPDGAALVERANAYHVEAIGPRIMADLLADDSVQVANREST